MPSTSATGMAQLSAAWRKRHGDLEKLVGELCHHRFTVESRGAKISREHPAKPGEILRHKPDDPSRVRF